MSVHNHNHADEQAEAMMNQVAHQLVGDLDQEVQSLRATVAGLEKERDGLQRHVHDLQSGMYINCVYCGHRYGPQDKVPATMADVLKAHVEKCPKHPMSAMRTALKEIGAYERDPEMGYDWNLNNLQEIARTALGGEAGKQ